MTDQELRLLVRDAVARHAAQASVVAYRADAAADRSHSSHALLPLARGDDGDGACLIERAVPCSHCGFCQSFGH